MINLLPLQIVQAKFNSAKNNNNNRFLTNNLSPLKADTVSFKGTDYPCLKVDFSKINNNEFPKYLYLDGEDILKEFSKYMLFDK